MKTISVNEIKGLKTRFVFAGVLTVILIKRAEISNKFQSNLLNKRR